MLAVKVAGIEISVNKQFWNGEPLKVIVGVVNKLIANVLDTLVPANTPRPILVIVLILEKVTLVKFAHPSKKLSGNEVMDDGIVTLVTFKHLENNVFPNLSIVN
jgi:hypothetical protein